MEARIRGASLRTRTLTIRSDRLIGAYFAPRAAARRPGIIALGGAGGGLHNGDVARALAAYGYPALALAYFRLPGLPADLHDIPLEYFLRARDWLARQPGVDPHQIVLLGGSRGGEAALMTAGSFPRAFQAVVALVPSSYLWPDYPPDGHAAWTLRGRHLPVGMDLPVARIDAPVLVAGAGSDGVWPSANAVQRLHVLLRDANFHHPHTEIVYWHAGHGIGTPMPAPGASHDPTNAARAKLWPALLDFLGRLRLSR